LLKNFYLDKIFIKGVINMASELSNRIKSNRNRLGMKQQELADKVGVSLMTVLRWEKGIRSPRMEEIKKLAEALNTSVEYLMGLTESEPQETPQINLPINDAPENKTPNDDLDLGFWGGVVERAERAGRSGDKQKLAAISLMLRMAVDAITGAEATGTPSASINAYNGDHSSYSGNIFNTGKD